MFSIFRSRVISSILLVVFIFTTIFLTNISLMTNGVYAATSAFSQIEAESYSNLSNTSIQKISTPTGGYGLGYISSGDYVVYDNLDFDYSGVVSFKAKIATSNSTTIEIRSDSNYGTLLGTLSVSSTGSWDTYQELSCNVINTTGTHSLYLVFGDAINIDWFTFTKPTSSFDAFSQIEAESYSSLSNTDIQKVSTPSGYGLGYISSGDNVIFNNVNFGSSGTTSFIARVATSNATTIEIRSDSSTGTLLGTLSVPSTGSWDSYQDLSCNVSSITGIHSVYLVFGGAVNIDWFTFNQIATVTNTPTATPTPTPIPTSTSTPVPTSTDTSSPTNGVIKIECYNVDTSSSINSLNPQFKITNIGSSNLDLTTVKLRYYYTSDSNITQNAYCDYSSVDSSNVNLACLSMTSPSSTADHYLEIGFSSGAGTLASGAIAYVNTRIANADWSSLTQSDDYSFNSSATSYTSWNYVTSYINNTLVWGIEPNSSTATQTPTPTVALAPPTTTPTITPTPTATISTQTSTPLLIEAENYSSLGGTSIQQVELATGGYGLGYISTDDYAVYNNIDFGNGFTTFKTKLATSVSTNIEIRVGNQDGPVIGNLYVSSTGSWDTYQEISCSINSDIKGVNSLCLKFKGPFNIDWFYLSGSTSTPTPTPPPTPTPAPNFKSAFVQIQAESYNDVNAQYIQTFDISDGGSTIGYLLSGDYIGFSNIDFGSGTTSFKARVAAGDPTSMEIRSGSPTGTLLGTVAISSTGSWDTFQEITSSVSNITGVNNLYFVFNGPLNFDWFVFSPNVTPAPLNAFSKIEAEDYDGVSGDSIKNIDNAIGYIQSGNYIVFNNTDFGSGAKSFNANVANASGSNTDIQVRLGSSTGTLLGTLSIPSTESWDTYQDLACNISTVTGRNNLYLVFTGPVNFDWFTFSASEIVATATPTITPSLTPTPTSTPTPTVALAPPSPTNTDTLVSPTPMPTIEMLVPTDAILINQPNITLERTAPPRAEIASVKTITSTQRGELTLNGTGILQGEKEIVLLVDNGITEEKVSTDIITPMDFGIFANRNIRGVGNRVDVQGGVHANEKLESYISDFNVSGTCSASTLSIGYGSTIEGGLETITSPLPMPVFHDDIIAEIDARVDKDDFKFYPSEFLDGSNIAFPGQPGFFIRYEENNNTFVITGAGTFNLESSMYFDGNVRISVPHIINTNSNFLVAEGFVNLEGHDINTTELDEDSINNTTNLLNIYSIHGRIFVATSDSKIYGTLYAAGEEDPTGKYTNDVGVVLLQGINTQIYGAIVAGSDIRIEGSYSTFNCVSAITYKIETKFLRKASAISSKEAAKKIADYFGNTNTKMYALHYSDKAYVDTVNYEFFDLSPEGNELAALKTHIDNFAENSTGFSNMGDALRRGKELLSNPTKSSLEATKYIIVLAANSPNKWSSNIDQTTGDVIAISGDGENDADGSSMAYALNEANLINSTTDIKTVFIDNSSEDISANIENIAISAGSAVTPEGNHFYSTIWLVDFSTIYKYIMTDPPKTAFIDNATYTEIFPEGIQVVDGPEGYIVQQVDVNGITRDKLIVDHLDIELTHNGTNYDVIPFTVEVKVRPRKLGDIAFSGNDTKVSYIIDYIDIDGNKQTAYFEKNFDSFTLNVYMSIDIG